MVLGIRPRREMKVEILKEKIEMNNLASQFQQQRMNLWKALKSDPEIMVLSILGSNIDGEGKRRCSTMRSWITQLKKDAEIIWKENAER